MLPIKHITLATHNAGKIKELQTLLSPIHCVPQHTLNIPDAEETGLTFIENAIIKARHASRLSHQPALADDSGLVVPALQGQPGIYSARYAGPNASDEDNRAHLLAQLADKPDTARHAFFYCALALLRHAEDPTPIITTGILHGTITHQPQGHHGFGYDALFIPTTASQTLAELSAIEKNKISHRAQAIQRLLTELAA